MEYEILSALNESHKVYLVRDKADGKVYVQKELSTYNASVYATLAQYPVQGIPRIINITEDRSKGILTIIEEYISGNTLDDLIETDGTLPEETVISYIAFSDQLYLYNASSSERMSLIKEYLYAVIIPSVCQLIESMSIIHSNLLGLS